MAAGIPGVASPYCDFRDVLGAVTAMGFLKRPRSTTRVNAKPTWRERRAAERTAKAEATLVETEQKIHEVADQIRSDLKSS